MAQVRRRDDTGLITLCYVRKAPEDMDGRLDCVVTGVVAKDVRVVLLKRCT